MENVIHTVKYTVSSKDTIAGIALKFGMPVAQFRQINRLQTGQIFSGQEVLVVAKNSNETKSSDSRAAVETVELKQQWAVDLGGVPLLTALRSKFRTHYVSNPTMPVTSGGSHQTTSPQLPPLFNSGFRTRFSLDLGVCERDVYSESTWFVINKRTAVLGRLIIGMGRIVFEAPLDSQDVIDYGLLACSFACFIEDVESVVISPLTTAQRELLAVPDTVLENYMLQIRSKDRQSISSDGPSLISNRRNSTVSETDPESDDFFLISSDGIAEGSTERNVNDGLESEKVRSILSYFVLNENHIRKLFQIFTTHINPNLCRMKLLGDEDEETKSTEAQPQDTQQSITDQSTAEVTQPSTLEGDIMAEFQDERPAFVPKTNYVSSILTKKDRNWLPERLQYCNWNLLYSTHYHGISLNTFYNNTEEMGPNIIVLRTAKSRIFGGFASESWSKRIGFYGTGESFLFELHPEPHVYRWTEVNEYFMHSSDDGLAMGGGRGHFGFWVDSEFYHGTSAPCLTFDNQRLSAADTFEVIFLECWGFES